MKKTLKRALALMLALSAAAGLAACGGTSGSAAESTATAAPEYVYAAEFTSILEDDTKGVEPLCMTEGGLYAAYAEKVGENIPEGVTPEYEGQYDINETRLEYIGFDGKITQMEDYSQVEPETDGEGKRDYSASASPQCAAVNADGELVILECVYTSYSEAPEDIKADNAEYYDYLQTQNDYYLRTLSGTGAEMSRVKLDIGSDEYIQGIKTDADGNIYVLQSMSVAVFSPEGKKKCDVTAEDYIYSICTLADGSVAALLYNYEGGGMVLRTIDIAAGELSADSAAVPDYAYTAYDGGGDYDFYYNTGSGLYGYKTETEEAERLFSWTDCDVNGDNVYSAAVGSDGAVRGLLMEYDSKGSSWDYELVTIAKTPYDAVPQKEHLSLATLGATTELRSAVIKFNRANNKYHVDITDYGELADGSADDALTKLNTEIMAGNMPDILDISDMPYTQLAAKGLLEDLGPYIDADSELNREDFFVNIFSAYEVGGKLCAAPAGFGVVTVEGASSVVGDTPGWTYDEYYAALAAMPEGCEGFDHMYSQNNMLMLGVTIDFESFVDWSTGECNFDSDAFKQLLEFAKSFTPDSELESYELSEEDNAAYRISQGKQMLYIAFFATFNEFDDDPFKTETTYIGFPNSTGEPGDVFNAYECYAISSACENKDAAWDFVRTFLTEDYQLSGDYFPTNRNAFSKLLADAQVIEYEKDANGNYVLDENGERIREVIGVGYDGVNYYNLYSGMSEEHAKAVEELVNRVTKRYNYDTSIVSIVQEQAAAYFAGQKSADEVAKLTQSKASLYVEEQR